MISKIKKNKLTILSTILGVATITGPIITNLINKSHERKILSEQHKYDIESSNRSHVYIDKSYRDLIDHLKDEVKEERKECEELQKNNLD